MCMRHTYASASAIASTMAGSPRSAVTSLTSSAPSSSARRATIAFEVSIETGRPTSPSSTGTTRASSASAETGAAPGRVDSPPTSTTAAPSASRRRPCSPALSGSTKSPPSEKLSGVTFTTPMTDGRGHRSPKVGLLTRGRLAPSATSARIGSYGDITVEHRPARPAQGDRLRDPAVHHHVRDLLAVLGLQDPGGGEEPLGSGRRRGSRPRDLHRRRDRHVVPDPVGGRQDDQEGRPHTAVHRLDGPVVAASDR